MKINQRNTINTISNQNLMSESNTNFTKKEKDEGFKRSDVDWKKVINTTKEKYGNKLELSQNVNDGSVHITKLGKQKFQNGLPIEKLGTGFSKKQENKLLNLYRQATHEYKPPLKSNNQSNTLNQGSTPTIYENPFVPQKPKSLVNPPKSVDTNIEDSTFKRLQMINDQIERQERRKKMLEKSLLNNTEEGRSQYDNRTNTYRPAIPRLDKVPPFVLGIGKGTPYSVPTRVLPYDGF